MRLTFAGLRVYFVKLFKNEVLHKQISCHLLLL